MWKVIVFYGFLFVAFNVISPFTGFQPITFWILYWVAASKRMKNEDGLTGVLMLNEVGNCKWWSSHTSSIPLLKESFF